MKETSIAIIGMSGRFPLAENIGEFWQNICEGRDCIRDFSKERDDFSRLCSQYENLFDNDGMKKGGYLDKIDEFDSTPFKFSPRETQAMDPQHRLLLEIAWEALEDAGQPIRELSKSDTGVFVGMSTSDFGFSQSRDFSAADSYTNTGMALSIASNRISYVFNLKGQSLTVDTACSSSLTAVYLACKSIAAGNSRIALAGGANLILSPFITLGMKKAGVLSPDGKCKTFDAAADGYVRGEGAGMVVLKRLDQALADGDDIYCVIAGGETNQNGRGNGLTAPNKNSQIELVKRAFENAAIDPRDVDYIEAHGTGTYLGDLIEANALGEAVGQGRNADNPCRIGSIKSNVGHLEAAAGIAGLMKVALAIKTGLMPPTINYENPNPQIPFAELGLEVQKSLASWQSSKPKIAGVSSFGFGGSNVHLVLREAPTAETFSDAVRKSSFGGQNLLPISAHSPQHLQTLVNAYRKSLSAFNSNPEAVRSFCAAAARRRSHREFRTILFFKDSAQAEESFEHFLQEQPHLNLVSGKKRAGRNPKIAYIFSGFGGQWLKMGCSLLENEPVFERSFRKISNLFEQYGERSIVERITGNDDEEFLNSAEKCQPLIFAIQVALVDVLSFYGIKPDFVTGHSFGEVAAAYCAEILDLEDAVRVILSRSRQLGRIRLQGKMAIIEKPAEALVQTLDEYCGLISFAAQNSPFQTVVAGDEKALENLLKRMENENVYCKFVNSDVAGHSYQIDRLIEDFRCDLCGIKSGNPEITFFSGFTGREILKQNINADYWLDNLRKPVLFVESIKNLAEENCEIFIEIGPHPVLLFSIEQTLQHFQYKAKVLPSLKKEKDCNSLILRLLCELYALGADLNWESFYSKPRGHVKLPTYPWHRQKIVSDVKTSLPENAPRPAAEEKFPLDGKKIEIALIEDETMIFEKEISIGEFPYLKDHRIGEAIVVPGSLYIETFCGVGKTVFGNRGFALQDVEFIDTVFLDPDDLQKIQTIVKKETSELFSARIYCLSGDAKSKEKWTLKAAGKIESASRAFRSENILPPIENPTAPEIKRDEFYRRLSDNGVNYGQTFQGIEKIHRLEKSVVGEISIHENVYRRIEQYHFHPAALDVGLQVIGASLFDDHQNGKLGKIFLPYKIKRLEFNGLPPREFYSCGLNFAVENQSADVALFEKSGNCFAKIEGIEFAATDYEKLLKMRRIAARHETPASKDGAENNIATVLTEEFEKAAFEGFSASRQSEFLLQKIKVFIGDLLLIPVEKIEKDSQLDAMGFDSLTSMQLKNAIQNHFEISISVSYLLQNPTVAELTEKLHGELVDELQSQNESERLVAETSGASAEREQNMISREIIEIASEVFEKPLGEINGDTPLYRPEVSLHRIPEFDTEKVGKFLLRLDAFFGVKVGLIDFVDNLTPHRLSLLIIKKQIQLLEIEGVSKILATLKNSPEINSF